MLLTACGTDESDYVGKWKEKDFQNEPDYFEFFNDKSVHMKALNLPVIISSWDYLEDGRAKAVFTTGARNSQLIILANYVGSGKIEYELHQSGRISEGVWIRVD